MFKYSSFHINKRNCDYNDTDVILVAKVFYKATIIKFKTYLLYFYTLDCKAREKIVKVNYFNIYR